MKAKSFLFWNNITLEVLYTKFSNSASDFQQRFVLFFRLELWKLIQSFLFKTIHLNLIHSSKTLLQWIELSLRQSDLDQSFQVQMTHNDTCKLMTKNYLQQSMQVSLLIQTFFLFPSSTLSKLITPTDVFCGNFWLNRELQLENYFSEPDEQFHFFHVICTKQPTGTQCGLLVK